MTKILIVDDDARKVSRITDVINAILLNAPTQIRVAKNLFEAGRSLEDESFDLLILDLNVPMRAGEDARADGGVQLLRRIGEGGRLRRPDHIIGLTGFEDLKGRFKSEFQNEMWYVILYDPASDEWADSLGRMLAHIAGTKTNEKGYDFDLAIVTALTAVELEAVLALPASWSAAPREGDDTVYQIGEFSGRHGNLRVVACAAHQMGMPAATALSMKVIDAFRPRYLAICGIAAGVEGNFGDILIADQSWDYGSGKSRFRDDGTVEFLPAPEPLPLSLALRARLAYFNTQKRVLGKIQAEFSGEAPEWTLKSKMGPMASGAAVLENRPLIEQIRSYNRKLIGVEMETYGVFMAATVCRRPRPFALSIKSICDLGDDRKDDRFQAYAAFTSSRFLYEFAIDQLASGAKQITTVAG